MTTVYTTSGRIEEAVRMKDAFMADGVCAIGKGNGSWASPPSPPSPTATALLNELARVPATNWWFLTPDNAGTILFNEQKYKTTDVSVTEAVTRGVTAGGTDALDNPLVRTVASVVQGATTYIAGTDFTVTADGGISWAPGGAEPAGASVYNVTYTYYTETNTVMIEFDFGLGTQAGETLREFGFFLGGDELAAVTPYWVDPPVLAEVDTDTENGTREAGSYVVAVTATNDSGESLRSTALSVTLSADGSIELEGTVPDHATGFNVYLGPDVDNLGLLESVAHAPGSFTYTDDGSNTPDDETPPPSTPTARSYTDLGRLYGIDYTVAKGLTGDDHIKRLLVVQK